MLRNILRLVLLSGMLFFVLAPALLRAEDKDSKSSEEVVSDEKAVEEAPPEHGLGHKILLYVPNRVLDLVDIVRLRVRVGPGMAVGARVTKPVSAYLGSYVSIYGGLPGPRMGRTLRSPIGLEGLSGASVSVADGTFSGGISPDYSPTEVEASLHLGVVGIDAGIDPVEIADFFAGFFMVDVRKDDF